MSKKWKISITAQFWDCETRESAEKRTKALLDAGCWWLTLTTFEPPPTVKSPPRKRGG